MARSYKRDKLGQFASTGSSGSAASQRESEMFKAKGGRLGKNGNPLPRTPFSSSRTPTKSGPSQIKVFAREAEARTGLSINEIKKRNAAAVLKKYGKK